MRARLVAAATLALIVLASAGAAGAGERPDGDGGAYVDDGGDPTAIAGEGSSAVGEGNGGGGGSVDPCHWRVVVEDDFQFGVYDVDSLQTKHSATGRWLQRWCDGIGAVEVDGAYLVPEGGLVDPYQLALDALASASIGPPGIRTSPSADGRLYVQVPTWLWIDKAWWQPYQATADSGRVWSRVTATPVSTSWSLGDGSRVTCRGSGTPWRPGSTDDTSCTHTYRRTSEGQRGGTFDIEATVTLEVSWTSNIADGGTLPAIARTSTLDVEVGEIQAIGTGGGR